MDKLITIKIVKISQCAEKELSQKTTMLKPANIVLELLLYRANIAGNGRERENENDRGRRKEGDNKGFARAEEEEMQNVG